MESEFKADARYIVDLNILNTHNARGCESCGRKFCLGETVVMAYGGWADDKPKLIHESEALYDPKTKVFYDKGYYQTTH